MNNKQQNLTNIGLSHAIPLSDIIGNIASSNGLTGYLCGGVVRDALLNRPSKDFDICVSGDLSKMKELGDYIYSQLSQKTRNKYEIIIRNSGLNTNLRNFLQNCGGGVLLSFLLYLSGKTDIQPVIYPRFLVGMTKINGEDIELVATRSEDYSTTEGDKSRQRNPGSVRVADEYEDAIRRDFTMNALYVNLATGELLDPTGNGISDIKNGIIRVTRDEDPQKVFMEDPLRILRAIRQSAQLGFEIEPRTKQIIVDLIKQKGKSFFDSGGAVSAERIKDELSKVLLSSNFPQGLNDLLNFGVLDIIMPEVAVMARDNGLRHKNLWQHTLAVMGNAQITPEIEQAIEDTAAKIGKNPQDLRKLTLLRLRLSSLLHDVGKLPARFYGKIKCTKCGNMNIVRDINDAVCKKCNARLDISSLKGPSFHGHPGESEKIATKILKRLKFDNQMTNWVSRDCALHQVEFANYLGDNPQNQMSNQPSKVMLAEKLFSYLVDLNDNSDLWDELNFAVRIYGLVQADSSANPGSQQQRVRQFISDYETAKSKREKENEWIEFNKPILSGDEIMKMFNIKPGVWIGNIHKRIREDKQNNPESHTREKAIQIAEEELAKWGPEIYNK